MELTSPSTIMHPDHERAKRMGFSKTTDSAAANNAALTFAAGGGRNAAQIETTLGDLIVALTEETHQFVADEQETYEWVAYLLSTRLSRRPILSAEETHLAIWSRCWRNPCVASDR